MNFKNVLSTLIVTSTFVAQTVQAQTVGTDVNQVSLDQVVTEVNDPKGKILPYVNNVVQKFPQMVAVITGETEATPAKKKSRLAKEFSKLRIKYTFDEFDKLIDTKFVRAGVAYQYIVEPAFRNDEQLRKDIWIIQAGATNAQRFSLGASGEIRFTFSRFFKGENAKLDAMKALPYLPTQIPSDVNEVKTKLKDGDGFRFEISGGLSAAMGESLTDTAKTAAGVSVGVRRSALFIMDLFKVNSKVARTRFFGLKNHGEISAGLSVRTESPLDLISSKLNDLFTLGLGISVTKPVVIKDRLPIDSMMVDYLFQFSSPDIMDINDVRNRRDIAESALEQILMNIKKGGFKVLFGGFGTEAESAGKLLEQAELAEKLYAEDYPKYQSSNGKFPFSKIRVYNYFKGRMQANSMSFDVNAKFSDLLRGHRQSGTLTSFITSFDSKMNTRNYILDNSSIRAGTRSLFGLNKFSYSFDFDVLIESNAKGEAGKVSDVVIRNQYEDTTLTSRESDVIRKSLIRTLPGDYQRDPKILSFFPSAEQTNSYLSYRYSFSEPAFKAIQSLSREEIAQRLFEYLDDHPNRANMHLDVDSPNNGGSGLGTYAEQKAHEIYAIINPKSTNQQSMEAFRIAQRDPIFEMYLIGEFFASLLPKQNTQQLFNLDAKITSAETGTKTLQIGDNKISAVYDAVSFLRSVINDRSLDLQMTNSTDNTGNTIYIPHGMKNQAVIPVQ